MALEVAHSTTVVGADDPTKEVNAAQWNGVAAHSLSGVATLAQGGTGNTTGTATVNADLTGIVTSVGNATAIANGAIALAKLANGTAGNVITYDAAGVIAVAATGTATHVLTSNGAGAAPTFQAVSASVSFPLRGANGTSAAPSYSFTDQTGTGVSRGTTGGGSQLVLNSIGTDVAAFSTTGNVISRGGGAEAFAGNGVAPALAALCVLTNGATNANANIVASYSAANATGARIYGYKSRGTDTGPTVVTTGDDLLTVSGFGYVGATNTYVEAATIRFDSTGTIADTATGVGGIIRFETREVGGAMHEAFRIQGGAGSPQMLASAFAASNSLAAYSFTASSGSGMQWSANGNSELDLMHSGAVQLQVYNGHLRVPSGSAATPGITDGSSVNSGLFFASAVVGISTGTIENSRFLAGALQQSKATADAVGYALNFRKSRGTVASPTVITTGDDLATISGFGYVGATGTYVEACQIKFDSTGTIANTTSGVGGIMRFGASVVGTVGITEVMRLQVATTTGGGWLSMDEADANPATTDLAADDAFAMYRKADKFVIAYNLAGAMNYLSIPLDGATTTWTNSAVAP